MIARHRYRKLLIAAAVAALLGNRAQAAPAGTVDFTVGGVTATGGDGRARPLAKGAEVNAGDRIVTTDGRAQIRFADGAFVSLQPQTEFAIREYRYEGRTDGSERGIFGLVKGAMRTVTGAIGRVNRGAYQIQTPTATIGIRGTGGLIQVGDTGQTTLVGTSGTWVVTALNNRSLEVPAGQVVTVRPGGSPEPQREGPVLPPPPLLPTGEQSPAGVGGADASPSATFATGDIVRADTGTAAVLASPSSTSSPSTPPAATPTPPTPTPPDPNPPLTTASGRDVSVAAVSGTPNFTYWTQNIANATATFDATGRLTDADGGAGAKVTLSGGTHAESGTLGGVVAWGRWTGGVVSTITAIASQTFAPNEGLHYVAGIPAPITALAGTGTVTYNLAGATTPTNGATTGTVTGGQLIATLGGAPTVTLQNFTFTMGADSYVMNKAGMTVTGPMSTFSASLGSSDFAGSSGGCAFSCSGGVAGNFYGTGASHAGITYKVSNPFSSFPGNPNTAGSAVFVK